jgi:quercetin dioxygenase-like cupin family protein
MRIPAGTVLTGAIHRHECFFLLRQGELAVTSADGVRYLQAGDMLVTPAGSKRAGVAVTACVVTTFHANPDNETDTQALWDLFTIPAPAVLLGADAQEVLP